MIYLTFALAFARDSDDAESLVIFSALSVGLRFLSLLLVLVARASFSLLGFEDFLPLGLLFLSELQRKAYQIFVKNSHPSLEEGDSLYPEEDRRSSFFFEQEH